MGIDFSNSFPVDRGLGYPCQVIKMNGRTHAITGGLITGALLTANTAPTTDTFVLMVVGTLGALLPDIDRTNTDITQMITRSESKSSFMQNIFKISILNIAGILLSLYVFKNSYPLILGVYLSLASLTSHRTLTHSLLSLGIVMGLVFLITANQPVTIALGIGYGVHLLEDMLTKAGIAVLYPIGKKIKLPIVTTPFAESMFLMGASLICIVKMVVNYSTALQ